MYYNKLTVYFKFKELYDSFLYLFLLCLFDSQLISEVYYVVTAVRYCRLDEEQGKVQLFKQEFKLNQDLKGLYELVRWKNKSSVPVQVQRHGSGNFHGASWEGQVVHMMADIRLESQAGPWLCALQRSLTLSWEVWEPCSILMGEWYNQTSKK